ncbi:MAG: DUF2306 domain-containing protein [Colwellia sp.]|nr:DUF2306 domain-containing protein [Colwellia sp.]
MSSIYGLSNLKDNTNIARKMLNASAGTWFLTAVFGQWFFAYYIMIFYGGNAVQGNWEAWSSRMIHGIIEGDIIGNIAVLIHILLAFVISFCGPLQFIPQIRQNYPILHRINGRLYIMTSLVISIAAIYMIWSREAIIGGVIGQIGTSLDGVLVIICAIMTVRFAMARKITIHRRWALRLFIVVSGVWFFRVIRGFWIFVNDGTSPGTNGNLTGPFDLILNFAGYLVPLLILECYFRVRDNGKSTSQYLMASTILLLTGAMGLGIYSAAHIFWLPNL